MKQEPTQLELYQAQRIEALQNELIRVNNELEVFKERAAISLKNLRLSNPDFLRPIESLETDYNANDSEVIFEIVSPSQS